MVDAAKKPQVGSLLRFGANMTAEVIGDLGRGRFGLEFHHDGDFDDQLDVLGEPPLPPYVRRSRDSESLDRERYQTVYAAEPRRSRGTDRRLSFHAGAAGQAWRAGHRSYLVDPACRAGYVSAGADGRDRKSSHGRGTLLAQRGERGENQSAPSKPAIESSPWVPPARARWNGSRDKRAQVDADEGIARLYLRPGDQFRVLDALITNFHLPGSTPLILVAAFAGLDLIRRAYRKRSSGSIGFIATAMRCSSYEILDFGLGALDGAAESPSQQFLRHCVRIRQSKSKIQNRLMGSHFTLIKNDTSTKARSVV